MSLLDHFDAIVPMAITTYVLGALPAAFFWLLPTQSQLIQQAQTNANSATSNINAACAPIVTTELHARDHTLQPRF